MKVARLAGGLVVWAGFTACAVKQSPEPSAPAASAASTAPADERAASPGSPVAPAPAPPAESQGLDRPKSKATQEEQVDLSTLDAAERALNQAKADLDRLALAEPPAELARNAPLDRAAEKKESKPARAPSAAGAAAPAKSSAVCDEACRAFSSLSRAANAVCRLDGSSGTHCSHAKHVLSDAQQRVASCACAQASD